MAQYSANTTLKVNAAVSAETGTDSTLYTAPANGYAVLNLHVTTGATLTGIVYVGGNHVVDISKSMAANSQYSVQIYVGPGQAVSLAGFPGPGSNRAAVTGVSFINTP